MIHEGYGPGFHHRMPLSPLRGILVPIPYPGPYPVIFSVNVALSRRACERSRSTVSGQQDGLGNSNIRLTPLLMFRFRSLVEISCIRDIRRSVSAGD